MAASSLNAGEWPLSKAKLVMPGLVPGIHVLTASSRKDVDGRDKPGHDEKDNQARHAARPES
jgi:hypothetical protein